MTDLNNLIECKPIKTLDGVLNWVQPSTENWAKYAKVISKRSIFSYITSRDCENIQVQKFHKKDTPKTLFCHDMKGGYLQDKFVEGSYGSKGYVFSYWSAIDVFVYFSHSFLTIPPLSWINAGHIHGVHVLGTLITEGKDGESIWTEILGNDEKTKNFVTKLSNICTHYGFDGYLLNVENELNKEETSKLVSLVSSLKTTLGSDYLVIWYDAVTIEGKLNHQNKLNSLNREFFLACDGIFLNYCWKEEDLKDSLDMAGEERKRDIYVGIDVFGRGCIGGGGFNTNEAVVVARKLDLSIALFACGWTHELSSEKDPFELREPLFWKVLSPHLYLHGPSSLPFTTNFCQGHGKKQFEHGIVISENKEWYNLREQCYQPTELCGYENDNNQRWCITYTNKDAYKGGGCICIKTQHKHRLFVCEFEVADKIILKTITKVESGDSSANKLVLVVSLDDRHGQTREIFLEDRDAELNKGGVNITHSKLLEITEKNFWIYRVYEIKINRPMDETSIINQISCFLKGKEPVFLGELTIEIEN